MIPQRYQEILSSVASMKASIGDIPDTGGQSIIQERVRTYTDYHDQLKFMSSEVRIELNNLTKSLRANRQLRKIAFKAALESPEIRAMNCSEARKREEAEACVATQDELIEKQEIEQGDLETLATVIENRLDAVKTSISNLRKEWELTKQQQITENASEKIRRTREAVEEGVNSGVLEVEGRGNSKGPEVNPGEVPGAGPGQESLGNPDEVLSQL